VIRRTHRHKLSANELDHSFTDWRLPVDATVKTTACPILHILAALAAGAETAAPHQPTTANIGAANTGAPI
jgi:hypothetical protein